MDRKPKVGKRLGKDGDDFIAAKGSCHDESLDSIKDFLWKTVKEKQHHESEDGVLFTLQR
jgi:hypothetical protein